MNQTDNKNQENCRRLAVIVPGAGYHCDKPLLYHGANVAAELGYELHRIEFTNLPTGIKGDMRKMVECFEKTCRQFAEQVADIDWNSYDEVVFIEKSVGTCVGVNYDLTHPEIRVRHVMLTPLDETFLHGAMQGIAFHGTIDTWIHPNILHEKCQEYAISLHEYEGGNHSLEVGDTRQNLDILKDVMEKIKAYLA